MGLDGLGPISFNFWGIWSDREDHYRDAMTYVYKSPVPSVDRFDASKHGIELGGREIFSRPRRGNALITLLSANFRDHYASQRRYVLVKPYAMEEDRRTHSNHQAQLLHIHLFSVDQVDKRVPPSAFRFFVGTPRRVIF